MGLTLEYLNNYTDNSYQLYEKLNITSLNITSLLVQIATDPGRNISKTCLWKPSNSVRSFEKIRIWGTLLEPVEKALRSGYL